MKCFIVAFLTVTAFTSVFGAPVDNPEDLKDSALDHEAADTVRYRKAAYPPMKSSYAPAPAPPMTYTYPAPAPTMPCAKNLLFSCQPSVAPVPCGAQPPAYGPPASYGPPPYAGAYSEPVPQWIYPFY